MTLSPGTVIGGRYRLEEWVASGRSADVWRGVDEQLDRTVALKILFPWLRDQPRFAERFAAEARALASVNHPGVVGVYEQVVDPPTEAYWVMEYVEGLDLLRTLARAGRLAPARTMALVAQAADALHALHEKGFVHGNVASANLLLRPDDTVVFTGFGVARLPGADVTSAGTVVVETIYCSPEQAMGEPITHLSDIFSLGLVAFECLAGRRAFEGPMSLERALHMVSSPPPALPPDVPPEVRDLVDRALAKDPADRWPSGAALAQAARGSAALRR